MAGAVSLPELRSSYFYPFSHQPTPFIDFFLSNRSRIGFPLALTCANSQSTPSAAVLFPRTRAFSLFCIRRVCSSICSVFARARGHSVIWFYLRRRWNDQNFLHTLLFSCGVSSSGTLKMFTSLPAVPPGHFLWRLLDATMLVRPL